MQVENDVIQTRVTVLGFSLALFIFATSNLVSVASAQKFLDRFVWVYLTSLVPLCLGFLIAILSLLAFLSAQTATDVWRVRLFCSGQILLYLCLSQFLASGVQNIVYELIRNPLRDGLAESFLKQSILILSLVVWLGLILFGPIQFIASAFALDKDKREKRLLWVVYLFFLIVILLLSASASYLKSGRTGLCNFFYWHLLGQLVQPTLWPLQGE